MKRSLRGIVLFGLTWAVACGTPESSNDAETEPAEPAARLFAPGVVSTGEEADELQPSIAADGRALYFTRRVPDGRFTLFVARRAADAGNQDVRDARDALGDPNAWEEPEPLPFSGTYDDQEPFISADGRRLYFTSNRPAPGSDEFIAAASRGSSSGAERTAAAGESRVLWTRVSPSSDRTIPSSAGFGVSRADPSWDPTAPCTSGRSGPTRGGIRTCIAPSVTRPAPGTVTR